MPIAFPPEHSDAPPGLLARPLLRDPERLGPRHLGAVVSFLIGLPD